MLTRYYHLWVDLGRLLEAVQERTAQLRESELKFKGIFDEAFQLIALLQPDGIVIEANQTALNFIGIDRVDFTGKPFWEIAGRNSPQLQKELKKAIALAAGGKFIRDEVEDRDARGRVVTIDFSLKPILDETEKVVLLIAEGRDISDRKLVEQELIRSNRELEQFAYIASHDLQEPLRKIQSFAELLTLNYQGKLGEKADKYINYITNSATRMQALIEDLLLYSRTGRVDLKKQPTDLNAILSLVKTDLSVVIAESNAAIVASTLPTVQANQVQMRQLLQNLIANGIKFRRDVAPEIYIEAQLQQQEWLISVRDNGIGIKPEYTEQIFAIFQRLHTRSEYPGTGIGLALCRKIVERHGGKIWVESEFSHGSTFYFTLPIT